MVLAIIQARMLSTRLPGKVMMKVCGKPLIEHMLGRLKFAKKIDKVVVATSDDPSNVVLRDHVRSLGCDVFCGPEDDVLERYYALARMHRPDAVVRLTGDCPLIDPAICDHVIGEFFSHGVDYAVTDQRYAEGLGCEVVSFKALEMIRQVATLPSEKEHVTLYIRNHPEQFKRLFVKNEQDQSMYRIVVDEPQDLEVVRAVLEHFSVERTVCAPFGKIKEFLDQNPAIRQKNAGIIRHAGLLKSLAKDKQAAL